MPRESKADNPRNNRDTSLANFMTVAQFGVKKASEALRLMSASAVRMDVISAGVSPTSRLSEVAGNPEDLVIGVYIGVEGDMPGHALLVFPFECALVLVDMITGSPLGTAKHVDEMEQSVLQEVGNIVTSSYLNALSDYYRCTLLPTPPSLAIDMAAAVIDSMLLNTGRFEEETISVVTKFAGAKRSLRGFFLYIPEIV
ncbi:MAG: chemotaxis protein CheC [Armatimonadetes bacterium]|nr:chemotaxis protein CheC [Armatimonadota bacterium]